MILNARQILELLRLNFQSLNFLESESVATERYQNKNTLVFEFDAGHNHLQVLKFYSLQIFDSYERQEREKASVLEEVRVMQSFNGHPNVVKSHHSDELRHGDQLVGVYIIYDKLPYTLTGLLKHQQRFSDEQVLGFLQQMDDVLNMAHYRLQTPVIHSDIKPSNIGVRVMHDGSLEYVLMDFDVAVNLQRKKPGSNIFDLSNKGIMRGLTPAYAPPEQVMAYLQHSSDISNRVDVFAAGAIAMQMLTGVPPRMMPGNSFYQLPWEYVNGHWADIFIKLCNNDPKLRARQIGDAFDNYDPIPPPIPDPAGYTAAETETEIPPPPEPEPTIRIPRKKNPVGKGIRITLLGKNENKASHNSTTQENYNWNYAPAQGINSNDQRANTVVVVFSIMLGLAVVSFIFNLINLNSAVYYVPPLFIILQIIVFITSIVVFINWMRRAYNNLHILNIPGLQFSEGWAAGSWFVPVLNLFRPYQIMREIWIETFQLSGSYKSYNSQLVGWWWGFYLMLGLFSLISEVAGADNHSLTSTNANTTLRLFSDIIEMAAIVFAIKMVKEVSEGERVMYAD